MAFVPGLNVLRGPNGVGKTNLLEAIAYMAFGRSPRGAKDAALVSQGAPLFQIRVSYGDDGADPERSRELAAAYRLGSRRILRADGRAIAPAELYGRLPCVFFSPDDLWLLKGAPASRRVLLDRMLVQVDPPYATAYHRYREALVQRNAALRAARSRRGDRALVAIWEPQLIEYGAQICRRRLAVVEALGALAADAYRSLAGGAHNLALGYVSGTGEADQGSAAAQMWEARIERALAGSRDRDFALGATTTGPHRDDFEALIDGRPARHFASQGEQRSAVLALKFAERGHLETVAGRTPLLLVDDVLSELDATRRSALEGLLARRGQVFLTTADEAQASLLPAAARFRVSAGEVCREP